MTGRPALPLLLAIAAGLCACAPGPRYTDRTIDPATDDLRAAYDQGVLSEREYEQQRDGLLRR